MSFSLLTPYTEERLERATALRITNLQLRIGTGFPVDLLSEDAVRRAADDLGERGFRVVALGWYRNLLDPDPAVAERDRREAEAVIRQARHFGTNLIGCFAGRVPDLPLEENIAPWKAAWEPLVRLAEDEGVRLAFENCSMFRGYPVCGINFSHCPAAYDLMFDALPSRAIGMEFDPSHCVKQRLDVTAMMRRFASKIFHVHLKDHERLPDLEQEYGCFDVRCSRDRFPGHGQVHWEEFFRTLKRMRYDGPLTIEAERDPEYTTEDEIRLGLSIGKDILLISDHFTDELI